MEIIGRGSHGTVYEMDGGVLKIEKALRGKFDNMFGIYSKLINNKLKHIVNVYSISYEDGDIKIMMEKLNNPHFTKEEKDIILIFKKNIGCIETTPFEKYIIEINNYIAEKSKLLYEQAEKYDHLTENIKKEKYIKLVKDLYDAITELNNLAIHCRDFKPDNILIDDSGNYKLVDLY